jgi:hypothetical protein
MSSASTLPRPQPSRDGPPAGPETAPAAVEFHYTQSDSFVALLHQLGATLSTNTARGGRVLDTDGGPAYPGKGYGGGIYRAGTLHLDAYTQTHVTNNTADFGPNIYGK